MKTIIALIIGLLLAYAGIFFAFEIVGLRNGEMMIALLINVTIASGMMIAIDSTDWS